MEAGNKSACDAIFGMRAAGGLDQGFDDGGSESGSVWAVVKVGPMRLDVGLGVECHKGRTQE